MYSVGQRLRLYSKEIKNKPCKIMNTLALQLKIAISGGKGKPSSSPAEAILLYPLPTTAALPIALINPFNKALYKDQSDQNSRYADIWAEIIRILRGGSECRHSLFTFLYKSHKISSINSSSSWNS